MASKSQNFKQVREVQAKLRELGHEVTYDWTKDVEQLGDSEPDTLEARECAVRDLKGVQEAELLIVLGYPGLCGTLIEVGAALSSGVPVWAVNVTQTSIFWAHPLVLTIKGFTELMNLLHSPEYFEALANLR